MVNRTSPVPASRRSVWRSTRTKASRPSESENQSRGRSFDSGWCSSAIGIERPVDPPGRRLDLEALEDAVHPLAHAAGIARHVRVHAVEGLAELLQKRPGGGEAQRRRGEAIAALALAHDDEILLHHARRAHQRGLGVVRQGDGDIRAGHAQAIALAAVEVGKAARQVLGEKREHLLLRVLGPRLRREHDVPLLREEPRLLREMGDEDARPARSSRRGRAASGRS